jgi:hypothetical protein
MKRQPRNGDVNQCVGRKRQAPTSATSIAMAVTVFRMITASDASATLSAAAFAAAFPGAAF